MGVGVVDVVAEVESSSEVVTWDVSGVEVVDVVKVVEGTSGLVSTDISGVDVVVVMVDVIDVDVGVDDDGSSMQKSTSTASILTTLFVFGVKTIVTLFPRTGSCSVTFSSSDVISWINLSSMLNIVTTYLA